VFVIVWGLAVRRAGKLGMQMVVRGVGRPVRMRRIGRRVRLTVRVLMDVSMGMRM
jgi:hypothetical protein